MAVHVVMHFYQLKGEHPLFIAEMEIVDMKARMQAAQVRDAAQEQRLTLAEREHERDCSGLRSGKGMSTA